MLFTNILKHISGFVDVETPTLFKKTPGVGISKCLFFCVYCFVNSSNVLHFLIRKIGYSKQLKLVKMP